MTDEIMKKLLHEQKLEITSYFIYKRLSETLTDENNRKVVKEISEDELKHYKILKKITKKEIKPNKWSIRKFFIVTKLFGLTFGIRLLELEEDNAQKTYAEIADDFPEIKEFIIDEEKHEEELIDMIEEEKLNYLGSVVLGLNDALVELTGALAGFTFAFQNPRLIALTGLITGISASFSMAASEYLSTKQDEEENAIKSSLYTGFAYILTVILLILPFLLLPNPFISLITTLGVAILIIFLFNYYISVAKNTEFKKRFLEMTAISLGVAILSFGIGILVKNFFGIDV